MVKSLAEYFRSKGAIELFCVINPAGSHFEELVSTMPVARGTVGVRLSEGAELGLVSKETIRGASDVLKLWVLTDRGMAVYHEVRSRQVVPPFREYRQASRQFDRERRAFAEYVGRAGDRIAQSESDGGE